MDAITMFLVIFFFAFLIALAFQSSKDEKIKKEFNANYLIKKIEYNDGIEGFIKSEKCNIMLQEDGILFQNIESKKTAKLKYSKITACGVFTDKQIQRDTITKNGSIIGRGALGGLVLGPVGAIVGGMSGINNHTQTITTVQNTYYLIINYKKTKTSKIESISFKTLTSSGEFKQLVKKVRPNINEKLNIEL